MAFEKFVQERVPGKGCAGGEPRISIHWSGGFGFLRDFWVRFPEKEVLIHTGLGNEPILTRQIFQSVTAYWDEKQRAIGFIFHEDWPEGSKKLSYSCCYPQVVLPKFFEKYGLDSKQLAGRYPVHERKEGDQTMYYILLKERET